MIFISIFLKFHEIEAKKFTLFLSDMFMNNISLIHITVYLTLEISISSEVRSESRPFLHKKVDHNTSIHFDSLTVRIVLEIIKLWCRALFGVLSLVLEIC